MTGGPNTSTCFVVFDEVEVNILENTQKDTEKSSMTSLTELIFSHVFERAFMHCWFIQVERH